MLINQECLEVLRRSEALLGLPDDLLGKVASLPSCRMRTYASRDVVFKAGSQATDVAILDSGTVGISLTMGIEKGCHEEFVDTIYKGSLIGWSSLVPPYAFTRTAVAITDCRLMAVSAADLLKLMSSNPVIGYELAMAILRVMHVRYLHVQQLLTPGKTQAIV